MCAPTGVAALNVEGQTIHSLFKLPLGIIGSHDEPQSDATRKLLNAIDTLVIDEISMVNADLMDAIDRALRVARGRRAEPFGGAQIVMFGDPYQLAPVPPRGEELRYVRDHYRSFWFFDAKVWAGIDRPATGRAVADARPSRASPSSGRSARRSTSASSSTSIGRPIRASRRCSTPSGTAIVTADIAQILNETGARKPPESVEGEAPIITLATRNDIVNSINARHLDALTGPIADGDGRDQRRLRAGGCRLPRRCGAQAQGRRAGDVPAQRRRDRSASRRAG